MHFPPCSVPQQTPHMAEPIDYLGQQQSPLNLEGCRRPDAEYYPHRADAAAEIIRKQMDLVLEENKDIATVLKMPNAKSSARRDTC